MLSNKEGRESIVNKWQESLLPKHLRDPWKGFMVTDYTLALHYVIGCLESCGMFYESTDVLDLA